jgi:uncharacterized damage-inducible protein DinB
MGIIVDSGLRAVVWRQFGAAIDMLENAINACPDRVWADVSKPQGSSISGVGFWYVAYHTLFWFDFYLSESKEGFVPPAPFTLSEFQPEQLPERAYSKDELRAYLAHGRSKCLEKIGTLTDEDANRLHRFPWGEVSGLELLFYNMRHVQHHAAQLNLMLRQSVDSAPHWVARAKS